MAKGKLSIGTQNYTAFKSIAAKNGNTLGDEFDAMFEVYNTVLNAAKENNMSVDTILAKATHTAQKTELRTVSNKLEEMYKAFKNYNDSQTEFERKIYLGTSLFSRLKELGYAPTSFGRKQLDVFIKVWGGDMTEHNEKHGLSKFHNTIHKFKKGRGYGIDFKVTENEDGTFSVESDNTDS